MKAFLRSCKDSLKNNDSIHSVCIGNQASDLDSIISSITYSYALSKKNNVKTLPILNIPQDEYNLRTDATWFLEKFGVGADDLIFYHQNPTLTRILEKLTQENTLRVILTDHNKLAPEQEDFLGKFVFEIIDHHADEKHYSSTVTPENRTIELIGSTCTLIAEKMTDEFLNKEREFCEALLGTILLDTVNLDPKFKKVTPKDETQANRLANIISFSKKDQDELFEKLFFERFNVSKLSSHDLLRSDYKEWKMGSKIVGVATAKRSLDEWFEKDPDLVQSFKEFLENRKLDILYVMCAYTDKDNQFKRELAVYSPDATHLQKACDYLVQHCKDSLDLTPWLPSSSKPIDHAPLVSCSFFTQHHMASSRKIFAEVIRTMYDQNLLRL
ncbi:hypothetical protein C9374_009954 [Naegleria lovaniensis]|uniref:DHHA2 domain-containing protein n=1 Tax=Naegleria lovaniensis TaxID=51637 RepID=A0AA88GJH6_NAELO|nr:uncharacterized protein C9374_009954 [Naegleria lovaniensis]KAG2375331.1 hypothetical protein C9374_009954 [Naegleria lovaniensis]